jgi:hypothetical protein
MRADFPTTLTHPALNASIRRVGQAAETVVPCLGNLLVYKRISGQDNGAEQASNLLPILKSGVSDFVHG